MILDISRLLGRAPNGRIPTGIDRVCLEYVRYYGAGARAALIKGRARRLLDEVGSKEIFGHLLNNFDESMACLKRVLIRSFFPPLPEQSARDQLCIYPGQLGLQAPGLSAWMKKTSQRPVFVVYDLIPLMYPEYCRAGERHKHEQRIRLMLECAVGLVTISKQTFDQLERWAKDQGLKMPPSVVAPLAPASLPPSAFDMTRRSFERPYFVVLGTIEPRKNHLLLLNLWRELVVSMGADAPHLVIIGQRGWECENVVDILERCDSVRPYVHELNSCPDEELVNHIKHAQALLFPSFAEGYGMPLVEALQLGTPVIASNLPVFQEIAPNVPESLHPLDGVGWLQAVRDYTRSDHPRRIAQLQRLQDWRCPNWADHFSAVDGLLESLE